MLITILKNFPGNVSTHKFKHSVSSILHVTIYFLTATVFLLMVRFAIWDDV